MALRARGGALPILLLRLLLALAMAVATLVPASALPTAADTPVVSQSAQAQSQPLESADQQVTATINAFNLLMDQFVHPLSSKDLLSAAWFELGTEAQQHAAPDVGPSPALTGSRETDVTAFRSALQAYLARNPSLPDGFNARQAAVQGMVTFVHESHTYALSPHQYTDFQSWSQGQPTEYVGIGISVQPVDGNLGLRVARVFASSPAEQAGVLAGDVILAVDGTDVTGMPPQQASDLIRGPVGAPVSLLVQRATAAAPMLLSVRRATIDVPFVTHRMLDDTTGYISLASFPDTSIINQVQQALDDLEASGAQALVLDLRDNPGGNVFAGTRLLEHFVPAGSPLYQEVDRSGGQSTVTARRATPWNLPLVVLVSGGSASMAEIFASAIQENHAGTIVGDRTAGGVAAGQVFALGDGSALQVTVSEILSGQGVTLNGVGVQPDDVVDTNPADWPDGQDQPLAAAVALLHGATPVAAGS